MTPAHSIGKAALLVAALLTLGACTLPVTRIAEPETGLSQEKMAQLSAMAAPYQDVQTTVLRPEDGCYWYRHVGPVETTILPLRTPEGRPICTERGAQAAS
ncbi:hypothetical protein LVO79_02400 [Roseivivax marinus]|nr:hypothetical protein [Roseivivax marinus]UMA65336.1 hypothetical protein LVO79_02400 [Roseivivax marinus]